MSSCQRIHEFVKFFTAPPPFPRMRSAFSHKRLFDVPCIELRLVFRSSTMSVHSLHKGSFSLLYHELHQRAALCVAFRFCGLAPVAVWVIAWGVVGASCRTRPTRKRTAHIAQEMTPPLPYRQKDRLRKATLQRISSKSESFLLTCTHERGSLYAARRGNFSQRLRWSMSAPTGNSAFPFGVHRVAAVGRGPGVPLVVRKQADRAEIDNTGTLGGNMNIP